MNITSNGLTEQKCSISNDDQIVDFSSILKGELKTGKGIFDKDTMSLSNKDILNLHRVRLERFQKNPSNFYEVTSCYLVTLGRDTMSLPNLIKIY